MPLFEVKQEITKDTSVKKPKQIKVKKDKPIKESTPEINENDFLLWILKLDPQNYPVCNGIIKRLQTHKRKGFILDVLKLINVYLKEKE
jgi:hypothetical protein